MSQPYCVHVTRTARGSVGVFACCDVTARVVTRKPVCGPRTAHVCEGVSTVNSMLHFCDLNRLSCPLLT